MQSLHIAVPGLVDADAGMLSFAPNLHWRDVDIVHTLMGRLQWNDARIGVDNDANMGAMAHYAVGEVAGTANLLYLAGAVGVGAGMIVDGRIVRGADGFAGEVGHMTVGPPDRMCGCGRQRLLGDRRSGWPRCWTWSPDPGNRCRREHRPRCAEWSR